MDNASTVILGMNPDEIREMFHSLEERINALNPAKEEIKYLTRVEVCDLLKISLPTLHGYVHEGKIIGHRIGRRALFSEADIHKAVKEIPNLKYSRRR